MNQLWVVLSVMQRQLTIVTLHLNVARGVINCNNKQATITNTKVIQITLYSFLEKYSSTIVGEIENLRRFFGT